jgi:hypothetical protein
MLRTSSLALYVLALTASSAAFADGSWVNIASTDGNAAGLSNIPGVPSDAQWVPNQFNNPVIGPTGIVTFRGQLAGTGIQSTAPNNSHIFVSGSTGGAGLSQIARAGNALPSNLAPGLICNTTSGTNGLGSTQFEAGNGGILITGNLNGTGVTSITSPFWMWRDSTGASNSILYRGGDVFNGLTMSVSAGSPQYVNNDGKALVYSTFTGTPPKASVPSVPLLAAAPLVPSVPRGAYSAPCTSATAGGATSTSTPERRRASSNCACAPRPGRA